MKLIAILIGICMLAFVGAYSTYGAPSEFGNETTTTCQVGGDDGVVNCTGEIKGSNLSGSLTWTDLYGYPVECSEGYVITELGDSVVCTKITGDNESWNQSHAETLFSGIEWDYNQSQATFDMWNATWSIGTGNASWNQTLAETLFPEIKWGYNFSLATFEMWNATWATDNVGTGNLSWNQSAADSLYAILGYGDAWNKTYADTLYAGIEWDYNQTTATYNLWNSIWTSTYNSTYDSWAYNQTAPAQTYADAQDVIFNNSIADYVDAQDHSGGNLSFNQSLTGTLYADIQWGYNMSDGSYNATYDGKADYQFTNNNFNGSGNITAGTYFGDWDGGNVDNDITIASDKKINFRDSDLYIHSNSDGNLKINADSVLWLTSPSILLADGAMFKSAGGEPRLTYNDGESWVFSGGEVSINNGNVSFDGGALFWNYHTNELEIDGNITADYYFGDGSQLTGIDMDYTNIMMVNQSNTATDDFELIDSGGDVKMYFENGILVVEG